MFQKINSCQLT